MELRLNKLISESGLCSRREADKFIEMGRVTVNGKQPQVGQKVTESDEVRVDGERLSTGKYFQQAALETAPGKAKNRMEPKASGTGKKPGKEKAFARGVGKKSVSRKGNTLNPLPEEEGTAIARPAKYGKYNKYAAVRKAARANAGIGSPEVSDEERVLGKRSFSQRDLFSEKDRQLKEAARPQFGKSVSRSAIAQRLAASPKSASLRKTSRNHPINKAKRNNRNQPGNK